MKATKKENGITLIALVITIIILLILAGAAVSIGLNGGDVFNRANQAKTEWNEKVNEQDTTLKGYIAYLDKHIEKKAEDSDWIIAWNSDGENWSNPYFREKSVREQFSFNGMDESYSLRK